MFKNFYMKELIGTKFMSDLYKHNGFIALYGDFYIDGELFFPISIKHEAGCQELFGNYSEVKYRKYFEKNFYKYISNEHKYFETIEDGLVLGSSGNYYHDLFDFYLL